MKTDYELFVEQAKEFLTNMSRVPIGAQLSDTDNLFDLGLLDSTNVIEVILFLESYFSHEILIDSIEPSDFFSLSSMFKCFSQRENQIGGQP